MIKAILRSIQDKLNPTQPTNLFGIPSWLEDLTVHKLKTMISKDPLFVAPTECLLGFREEPQNLKQINYVMKAFTTSLFIKQFKYY